MSTGPSLRVEHSCNDLDDDRVTRLPASLARTQTEPSLALMQPEPSVTRRKIRNKSIRNTKDSAEMARLKYQRQKAHHLLPSTNGKVDRHFSVANVGSNGTMYLRYEHEPQPQDPRGEPKLMLPRPVARPYPRAFRPPPTPPDTEDPPVPSGLYWHDGLHESAAQLTAHDMPRRRSSFDSSYSHRTDPSDGATTRVRSPSVDSNRLLSPTRSIRPNTADPLSPTKSTHLLSPTSTFHPLSPTTALPLSPTNSTVPVSPTLEVPIPTYRLGSPRFSERGTAFLHNSSHTAFSSTTDLRLLAASPPPQGHQTSLDLHRSPNVSWFSPSVTPAAENPCGKLLPSPLAAPPLEQEDQNDIPYTIYDKVAADPDNSAWVRYDEGSKGIIAATPARLIAEITSVKFLDYDLLSDFFLTYRAFLSPSDLARYLIARLRWAVCQTHESGRVVRVRTFVALRHWTLNYFTQDFEPDHELRVLFCDLVNKLGSDLQKRPQGGGGDLQVLSELQKCWNRTCALVWGSLEAPQSYKPLRLEDDETQQLIATTRMRSLTGESHMRNSSYMGASPAPLARKTTSVLSDASVHATSCSFPTLKRSKPDLRIHTGKPGHRSPKKAQGSGASNRHKRSDSFSDALRDSRLKRPTAPNSSVEVLETLVPVRPGRIIRGLVIHPRSANVVGPGPPSPPFLVKPEDTRPSLSETLLRPPETSAHHGPLKLFGSVRRALSTRTAPKSPFSTRPKTATSGDSRKLRETEPQPRDMIRQIHARKAQGVHTDALAAMVMRSWEQQSSQPPQTLQTNGLQIPVARQRSKTIHTDVPRRPTQSRLDSGLTTSSRSIVIVDDTGIDESERTPDLARTMTGIQEYQDHLTLRRQTTQEHDQAALREMAMNNTAFLLPEHLSSSTRPSWAGPSNSATLSTTLTTRSIASAPQSPPPSIPLPPLPIVTDPHGKTTSSQEIYDFKPTPESEVTASFDMPRESLQESPRLSFRKSSSVDPAEMHGATRQLRRRPGGNLREVDTVREIQRRQSTGSLTSPVYSSPTSTINSGETGDAQIASRMSKSQLRPQFTDGDLFDSARKSSMRLLSTHSSIRNLRPSMEVEVAKLRSMSHYEDDGGVESALLKLEGRFISSRSSNKTLRSFGTEGEDGFPTLTRQTDLSPKQTDLSPRQTDLSLRRTDLPLRQAAEPPLVGGDMNRFAHRRAGAVDIVVSDESTEPAEPVRKGHQKNKSSVKDFAAFNLRDAQRPITPHDDQEPRSPDTPNSTFLLDDGESLLSRTSEISTHHEPKPSTDQSFFNDEEEDDAVAGSSQQYLSDQFQSLTIQHPLTPPTTADALSDHGFDDFSVQLLLPGPPSAKPRKSVRLSELLLSDQFAKKADYSALPRARHLPTHHTPFILAHTSEALALQFTLIEKDALDSVDWKDLINLNWSRKVNSVRDWAQYIHSFPTNMTEISSIDLIITRFNLVIKWCISSILLCGTPEERAECITKFIHIATHSHRRLRNFATTAQITIALLSSDLARLTSTWMQVAQAEKDALKELENLVSPMRNFAVLRADMESAAAALGDDDVSAGRGVIPFLGVYTRDLALNAQKAAFISPSQAGDGPSEKLVNFERHRTAASIVKGVLRLLDAGSRYAIKPEAEVLAKCLWLAALADSEITELSKGLEK